MDETLHPQSQNTVKGFEAIRQSPIHVLLDKVEWEILPTIKDKSGELPYATHKGVLKIGDVELECYVLSDGQRIFSGEAIQRLVKGLTGTHQ